MINKDFIFDLTLDIMNMKYKLKGISLDSEAATEILREMHDFELDVLAHIKSEEN